MEGNRCSLKVYFHLDKHIFIKLPPRLQAGGGIKLITSLINHGKLFVLLYFAFLSSVLYLLSSLQVNYTLGNCIERISLRLLIEFGLREGGYQDDFLEKVGFVFIV